MYRQDSVCGSVVSLCDLYPLTAIVARCRGAEQPAPTADSPPRRPLMPRRADGRSRSRKRGVTRDGAFKTAPKHAGCKGIGPGTGTNVLGAGAAVTQRSGAISTVRHQDSVLIFGTRRKTATEGDTCGGSKRDTRPEVTS